MKKVNKENWKTADMPPETAHFPLKMHLKEDEFSLLQHGYIPQEMEDK